MMKKFSTQKRDFQITERDKVIDNAVRLTGLDKSDIKGLYESFSYENAGNYDKINESFADYFRNNPINFEKFKDSVLKITQGISDELLSDEDNRKIFNNKLLKTVEEHVNRKPDMPLLLEIIAFILNLKNRNRNVNIFENFVFGQKITDLFEHDRSNDFDITDWDRVNVNPVNPVDVNIINSKADLKFYGDLKLLLSKYSSPFGNNYHIRDIYKEIVEYIDKESEFLANFGNVQEFDKNKYDEFLDDIINDRANIMNQNVDLLKAFIPDLQTLVFDLVLLTDFYINNDTTFFEFVDRNLLSDYKKYRDILLRSISSSAFSSRVNNNKYTYMNQLNGGVGAVGALDSINIIKSVQTEFNLKIRKIINVYHTKTSEMLIRKKKYNIQRKGLTM